MTYELQQKDFDEMVAQHPVDFETVCELRDTILDRNMSESYEGPELLDPRLHFVPLKQLIIKKRSKNASQTRRLKPRRDNLSPIGRFEHILDDLTDDGAANNAVLPPQNTIEKEPDHNVIRNGGIVRGRSRSSLLALSKFFSSQQQTQSLKDSDCESYIEAETLSFEQVKSYNKYFLNSNIERILKKFNPVEKIPTTKSIKYRKGRSRRELPSSTLYAGSIL